MPTDRFAKIVELIDAANSEDPNQEVDTVQGQSQPKELLYSLRMAACLNDFEPAASEALRIAVRAQHLQRWKIPRSEFNMDRAGYLQWRRKLGQFHAQRCGELMADAGYNKTAIERVSELLQKKNLKQDEEAQCLEDVACLVFIQFYLDDFAPQHQEQKLIPIVQKTWNKMSSKGQATALSLKLSDAKLALISKALSSV